MSNETKTHYRKAFNSPYLSSADIVEPTVLTIKRVTLETDRTKKTKDLFNTAHFVESHIRDGEELKPMVLNATNSRTLKDLAGSSFIDDWKDVSVTIYVDQNVRFGRDTVEGLRISPNPPQRRNQLTANMEQAFQNAVAAYQRDGNLDAVRKRIDVSAEVEQQIKEASDALG